MSADEQTRRPNRAHGAIDKLPAEIQLQIKDWYLASCTYQEISDLLKEDGCEISKSQVHRWLARKRNELERIETARERAEALSKYLVPDGADVEGAAVALAGALCLEALADADLQAVRSVEDLAKVSHSLGRLQSSAVAREKWEHERGRKIRAAVEQVKENIKQILDGMPELTRDLLNVVERAERTMLEPTA